LKDGYMTTLDAFDLLLSTLNVGDQLPDCLQEVVQTLEDFRRHAKEDIEDFRRREEEYNLRYGGMRGYYEYIEQWRLARSEAPLQDLIA